eukprot:s1857_g2.t1
MGSTDWEAVRRLPVPAGFIPYTAAGDRGGAVVMQIVAPARFLDGVVFAVFLLFVSGAGLFIFGEFHKTGRHVLLFGGLHPPGAIARWTAGVGEDPGEQMGVLRDVAFHDPGRRGSQGRVSSALTQDRHARELPWESSLQGNRKEDRTALLADRDLRLQARAAQFLDASPKQLLQETQRLQLENTRLRDKDTVKLLQSQSTQVCTQRTGRKGGQVSNSFVEEEEEEVEDQGSRTLADAELRKVLEESNEAAEEALAAAEVAVITEAVAFVGKRPSKWREERTRVFVKVVGETFRLHVPKSLRLLCAGAAEPVPRLAMSFYRAMSRCILRGMAVERAVVPWYHEALNLRCPSTGDPSSNSPGNLKEQVLSPWQAFCRNSVYPVWFKYVKGPMERYQYEHTVAELRGYGLMQDDQHNDKHSMFRRWWLQALSFELQSLNGLCLAPFLALARGRLGLGPVLEFRPPGGSAQRSQDKDDAFQLPLWRAFDRASAGRPREARLRHRARTPRISGIRRDEGPAVEHAACEQISVGPGELGEVRTKSARGRAEEPGSLCEDGAGV